MKTIWVHKAGSFKEAEEFDRAYYRKMSGAERINLMQYLREIYFKMKCSKNENPKRLRRVIRIIEQK